MKEVLLVLWSALNSPTGVVVMASVVLWVLNRVYAKKPAWQRFEGTIIQAVKWAEKTIPDNTANKAAKRMDEALQYVLRIYEHTQGKSANPKTKADLKQGISIVHAELEASGNNI